MYSTKTIPNFRLCILSIIVTVFFLVGCTVEKQPLIEKTIQMPKSTQTTINVKDTIPIFDAQAAYKLVEKQLSFGARVPGSSAHTSCRDFLLSTLRNYADTTFLQSFKSVIYGKSIVFSNIIGSFNPKSTNRILICGHWDSRPRSEQDPSPNDTSKPCPAANDGASGVAVLLEIARVLKDTHPSIGVDVVFFDGEDYGYEHDLSNYFIGARHFAGNIPFTKPRSAVLLDLVGDKDAEFRYEPSSMQSNPEAMRKIWDIASRRNCKYFIYENGNGVSDDHDMLIQAGIPSIDIIDVNLVGQNVTNPRRKYWHTTHDTIENISAETLGCIGQCLLEYVLTY